VSLPNFALPGLDWPYEVNAGSIGAYRRDGHVLLRGLASSDEAAAYRTAIRRTALRLSKERRPMAERDTYGKAFLQVFNLWRHSEDVARFVLANRFAGVAAALLGVERVRVYHDQALFKEPGGGRTPWHQDALYWPLEGRRCVTMWMPLVGVTPDMGSLSFASGTNAAGALSDTTISDASADHFDALLSGGDYPVTTPATLSAGDATFHGGWTVHRAGPNASRTLREVMTVIWFADGTHIADPRNSAQRHDLARWLPGQQPGERAGTPGNPRLPS